MKWLKVLKARIEEHRTVKGPEGETFVEPQGFWQNDELRTIDYLLKHPDKAFTPQLQAAVHGGILHTKAPRVRLADGSMTAPSRGVHVPGTRELVRRSETRNPFLKPTTRLAARRGPQARLLEIERIMQGYGDATQHIGRLKQGAEAARARAEEIRAGGQDRLAGTPRARARGNMTEADLMDRVAARMEADARSLERGGTAERAVARRERKAEKRADRPQARREARRKRREQARSPERAHAAQQQALSRLMDAEQRRYEYQRTGPTHPPGTEDPLPALNREADAAQEAYFAANKRLAASIANGDPAKLRTQLSSLALDESSLQQALEAHRVMATALEESAKAKKGDAKLAASLRSGIQEHRDAAAKLEQQLAENAAQRTKAEDQLAALVTDGSIDRLRRDVAHNDVWLRTVETDMNPEVRRQADMYRERRDRAQAELEQKLLGPQTSLSSVDLEPLRDARARLREEQARLNANVPPGASTAHFAEGNRLQRQIDAIDATLRDVVTGQTEADAAGLVWYHGTTRQYEGLPRIPDAGEGVDVGIFATSDPAYAQRYAGVTERATVTGIPTGAAEGSRTVMFRVKPRAILETRWGRHNPKEIADLVDAYIRRVTEAVAGREDGEALAALQDRLGYLREIANAARAGTLPVEGMRELDATMRAVGSHVANEGRWTEGFYRQFMLDQGYDAIRRVDAHADSLIILDPAIMKPAYEVADVGTENRMFTALEDVQEAVADSITEAAKGPSPEAHRIANLTMKNQQEIHDALMAGDEVRVQQAVAKAHALQDQAIAAAKPKGKLAEGTVSRVVTIKRGKRAGERVTREYDPGNEPRISSPDGLTFSRRAPTGVEPVTDYVRRVRKEARAKGLPDPGFAQSERFFDQHFAEHTAGGMGAHNPVKRREYRLMDAGVQRTDMGVVFDGIQRNTKAMVTTRLVQEIADRAADNRYGRLTPLQAKKVIESNGWDPREVALWFPDQMRDAFSGTLQERYLGERGGAELVDTVSDAPMIKTALDRSMYALADVPDHLQNAGARIVLRSVMDELQSMSKETSAGRFLERLKSLQSRTVLGTFNINWLLSDMIGNTAVAGLLGRASPVDLIRMHSLYRRMKPADRQALEAIMDTGQARFGTAKGHMGATVGGGGFADQWRALRSTPLASDKNPLLKSGAWLMRRHPVSTPINAFLKFEKGLASDPQRQAVFMRFMRSEAFRRLDADMGQLNGLLNRVVPKWFGGKQGLDETLMAIAKDQKAVMEIARQMNDVMGDYSTFTNLERRTLARVLFFYPYLRYSLRLTFWTLPIHHPIRFNIMTSLSTLTEEEQRQLVGAKESDWPLMMGRFFFKDPNGVIREFNLSTLNPTGNAFTQAEGSQDLLALLPPVYQEVAAQVLKRDLYRNRDWRTGGQAAPYTDPKTGEKVNPPTDLWTRFKIAVNDLAVSSNPVFRAMSQYFGPGEQGNDSIFGSDPTVFRSPQRQKDAAAKKKRDQGLMPSLSEGFLNQQLKTVKSRKSNIPDAIKRKHGGKKKTNGNPVDEAAKAKGRPNPVDEAMKAQGVPNPVDQALGAK